MDLSFDSFVLAASTADLGDEPTARDVADAVEFRMDLADNPLDGLDDYDGELPILATNRADWEGGEADGDEVDRLDALVAAAESDAVAAVDIELDSLRSEVGVDAAARARAAGATIVASVHDFERTPARSELTRLLHEAATLGDVGKLAVTAQTNADALRLLDVTHTATEWGDTVATMAMGEAGRHTRAVSPVYGSKIGYAPVEPADATAPGQYGAQTLRSLVDDLSSNPDV
ncbi:type I 3-dehydroquinate dehydratase [Haloferax mediterranei ATCC 33500]|uniref:3-dehydroquinate dehydratase n=1 Tax=Haloferax mediterranei (strain ATCC 33500 / DSM 1411 / JCM 8866 / NBRC 14739 / NCIMB 2177 / R-4) TaxID=523841 RepID=I3R2M2_HALMT|nr:type I 3-dehydroquinate dehydratase [Haloferax mediterranei]AFK18482.1 3-dehydroquinate dehydratase [Haloferax mediterranei ATCC 33500]AHZ22136.1 3-dehydroquinate dehydratase [Haloferax mediterranei ATCC 33500]EMA02245.1 3-dehydroquinate dehydratase [Haloferax mediterranei ATCC 33500]MDX5988572.1 type I 3-dehydroquinate dehydratase [Haloferax mediterranei ATCC 33500]QCQ74986.1 type I 3-dehydroquinate dehydratase [Haloferax mediterranei ATCC 33500]